MKTVGIICEYNPFHSGHAYQIEQIRQQVSDAAIVCLMSGHATQRGVLAIADRYSRAAMAISGGADVVLELPYPYSAASAAYFAGAGVAILDALGVDALSFGCECTDTTLLHRAAALTQTEDFLTCVRDRQKRGEGSAAAYFAEMQTRLSDSAYCFLANDILALEYMRAILAIDSRMEALILHRLGSAYRAQSTEEGKHPSATALRALLEQGDCNGALRFVPKNAREALENAVSEELAPANMQQADAAILSFFRLHDPQTLTEIAEMQGGLPYRLHDAAMHACSVEEMMRLASSKSYPTARLRRAILYAMTGVTVTDLKTPPAYLSLLAANAAGRELLRHWRGNTPIPIVTKPADAFGLSAAASRRASLSLTLDALFALTLPRVRPADFFVKSSPRMF